MNLEMKAFTFKDSTLSCYFKTDISSLLCTIKAEQKVENDTSVLVEFNIEDRHDLIEMIESALKYVILEDNCTTKFVISFYVINDGPDIASLAINSFTCCAILYGIRIRDTLSAYTYVQENNNSTVFYMSHKMKIIGFYVDGEVTENECLENISRCIECCESTCKIIKDIVVQQIQNKSF